MNKFLILIVLIPLQIFAQDISTFCQAVEEPNNTCAELLNLSSDGAPCENCNELAARVISTYKQKVPVSVVKELCQLPDVNPSAPENVELDQFCTNPSSSICSNSSYALDVKELINTLPSNQRNNWLGYFYQIKNNAIASDQNGKHLNIRDLNKRSEEFKKQIFKGKTNDANLITSFAADSIKRFSSDGNTSTGRDELKKSIVKNYSTVIDIAKESSLNSHDGYKVRANNLSENLEDKLATADEFLGLIQPSPVPDSWKNEAGKEYWVTRYGQYLSECGNDGLNPRVFYSRFKMNGTGETQEKLVVCPGFALKLKNNPNDKDILASEISRASADYLAMNSSGFNKETRGDQFDESEEIDPKEKEYLRCHFYASSLKNCYPETDNSNAKCNRESENMGVASRLHNEMLGKFVEAKGLKGLDAKKWMEKSLKGSCQDRVPEAFSAGLRKALNCQVGINFEKACNADGSASVEDSDNSSGLSCVSACLNDSCTNDPILTKPSPRGDSSLQGGATRVLAPATLGPGYSGRRSCFYNTSGSSAYQAALPKGYRCPNGAHASSCDLDKEPNCLITWQRNSNDKRGVTCLYNNAKKGTMPNRIDRNQELVLQEAMYLKDCLISKRYIINTSRGYELRTQHLDSPDTAGQDIPGASNLR